MKKTYVTTVPNHIGAFLSASRLLAALDVNITRVSYNKAVDSHTIFIEAEGSRQQLAQADEQLAAIGYLRSGGAENRNQEISTISRSLKALAKELSCPVLALSQLNRALESRLNKRPCNADLRDSGSIEQDADVILFLYRDELYDPNTLDRGIAEVIVSKQRNGPVGTVRTRFISDQTRFESLALRGGAS